MTAAWAGSHRPTSLPVSMSMGHEEPHGVACARRNRQPGCGASQCWLAGGRASGSAPWGDKE